MLGRERHQQRIAQALALAVQEYAEKVLARRLVADRPQAPRPPVAAAAGAR
jgi:hypothetical protein